MDLEVLPLTEITGGMTNVQCGDQWKQSLVRKLIAVHWSRIVFAAASGLKRKSAMPKPWPLHLQATQAAAASQTTHK